MLASEMKWTRSLVVEAYTIQLGASPSAAAPRRRAARSSAAARSGPHDGEDNEARSALIAAARRRWAAPSPAHAPRTASAARASVNLVVSGAEGQPEEGSTEHPQSVRTHVSVKSSTVATPRARARSAQKGCGGGGGSVNERSHKAMENRCSGRRTWSNSSGQTTCLHPARQAAWNVPGGGGRPGRQRQQRNAAV